MRIRNFIAVCLLACSTCLGSKQEEKNSGIAVKTVCRAAIDIGSGSTKLCVAYVDEETGRVDQIVFGEEFPILVGHDLKERNDGRLGSKILQDVENQVRKYRDLAVQLGAEKVSGVATAVFRESINGRAFIDRISKDLGVDLRVISQEEEGNIGFLTAVACSGKEREEIISWDSGGASFQISYSDGEKLSVYKGAWGSSKVLAEMVSTVQGREFTSTSTANPSTIDDVKALCKIIKQSLPPVSKGLENKIHELEGNVVAIGGGRSIFDIAKIALGKRVFSKKEVWSAIESLAGKTDEELSNFPEERMVISRLALLYSVMDHFRINSVHSFYAVGSTLGMFMDQHYWNKERLVAKMKVHYRKDPAGCIQRVDTIRRAAFDFGGGSIRVVVADVDLKTKKIEKLFSGAIPIQFRLDLAQNSQSNEFSLGTQKIAFEGMRILQEAIGEYSPQQFSATATEAFRMANNGSQLLESITMQTGVPIQIIDQKEEGRLGFLSAVAYSSSDPETTVVVDLGTGSAQITAQSGDGSLSTHGMKLGSVVLREMIAKEMRKLENTPDDINPVIREEAIGLIDQLREKFDALPQELIEKLRSKNVRVIATCGVLNTPVIRGDSGWDLLENSILERKTGEGINEGCPVKAIFCFALIDKFAVEECLLISSNREGNTSGMLITEKFWR